MAAHAAALQEGLRVVPRPRVLVLHAVVRNGGEHLPVQCTVNLLTEDELQDAAH